MVATLDDLSKESGLDKSKIREYRHNYVLQLMQRGLLVDQDIGFWRAQTILRAEDLGIEMSEEEKAYVSLGHQKLMPPEIIRKCQRAESHGRQVLEKLSIPLMLGRFVPVTAMQQFQDAEAKCKQELFEVRDEIIKTYDDIVDKVKADLKSRAEAVHDRMEIKPEGRSAWVQRFVDKLIAKLPSKEQVSESFHWETHFSWIPLPSSIEEEALKLQNIRKEQELLHFEKADRQAKMEEMNQMVVDQIRKQKEKVAADANKFLDQTVFRIRQMVHDACAGTLKSIQRNDGKLLGANVKSLRGLVDKVRALNFYNDQEVSGFIDKIEKHVAKKPGDRSVPAFKKVMKDIQESMSKSVRAVETEVEKEEEMCRIIGKDLIKATRQIE